MVSSTPLALKNEIFGRPDIDAERRGIRGDQSARGRAVGDDGEELGAVHGH